MLKENVLKDKSFVFAIRCVKLYKYLCHEKREYVLSKQLLRSGTAIGALVAEGEFAQSRADFVNKLSVALKEANESVYWSSTTFAIDSIDAWIIYFSSGSDNLSSKDHSYYVRCVRAGR